MAWPDAASRVRVAFQHAFRAYETHAFGADELRPLTNTSSDRWGRLAITMTDSLDTMLLMGMDTEAQEGICMSSAISL